MSKLKNNIEPIANINKQFAEIVSKAKKPYWYQEFKSDDNKKNFLVNIASKSSPAYNPVNTKNYEDLKKNKFYKEDCTVIVGIGLGHMLNFIFKHMEEGHTIVLVEPEEYMLKKAFMNYDFSKQLKSGELVLTSKKEEIQFALAMVDSRKVVQGWSMLVENYTRLLPDKYGQPTEATVQVINQMQCNIGTVMGAGGIIAENDIANLPYIIRDKGVSVLKDIYKDKPAVLVSTGPSLQKNIHILRQHQGEVVVIAVAQALRVLLAYDIIPDFICTVDYGAVNLEHFEGLFNLAKEKNIPLVALNRSYAEILKRWKAPKFAVVSKTEGTEGTAVGLLQSKGSLEQGGSVAHLNLGLAIHLGCNPIIFTGQDLAYEGDLSHISLVDANGNIKVTENGLIEWDVDDPRSPLKTEKHSMGGMLTVNGYFDEPVKTNAGLASFITSFESIINYYPDNDYYNATEGGAKIKGAKEITLKKAISDFGLKVFNKREAVKPYLCFEDNYIEKVNEAIAVLSNDIKDLNNIVKYANNALKTTNKMKKTGDHGELKKLFKLNEKWTNKAHELSKKQNLVGLHIYNESRMIYSRELKVNGSTDNLLNNKDDLNTRIMRTELILNSAKNAATRLRKIYMESKNVLVKYVETGDENLLVSDKQEVISIDDAEQYFAKGNWARPYLDAIQLDNVEVYEKALKLKYDALSKANEYKDKQPLIDYNYYLNESRRVGREEKDFDKALSLIRKAIDILPDRVEARWGLATSLHHLGNIDESIIEYEKLVKDFPDNTRFKFELGQVYLQKDIVKGMNIIKDVMEVTDEYDNFLYRVSELYYGKGLYKESMIAISEYLKKFPYSIEGKKLKENIKKVLTNN